MNLIENCKIVFPCRDKYEIAYSKELEDLVYKLTEKDCSKRLGFTNDSEDILSHDFFKGIDLEKLASK